MTFNEGADLGGNRVRKRGRSAGLAVGGGGLGVVALFLLSQFLGVDLTGLVGGGQPAEETGLVGCETGADANENVECRMEGAALSIEGFWQGQLGERYAPPEFVLFTGATQTGCGGATSAVGPFYCPADQTIYIDTTFYDDLRGRFGAQGGPLAEMYVVAHEWGHHIQYLLGTMDSVQRGESGPTSDAVRLEIQADCFAGAWAGQASTVADDSGTPFLEPVTPAQVEDALNAASAIGDDRIQESTQGQVNPETWTHGSAEMRQRWFSRGYEQGVTACDSFSVPGAEL